MIEAFTTGFLSIFTWPAFPLMLVGIGVGAIVGLLPGVGGIFTLALLLPFTYELEPTAAFALLLAAVTVSATTGDITSILFGIPGDSTSAAVVVDGYQMSKRGEAGRALSSNLLASLMGAGIGAFAIVVAIPVMQPLVRAFASPEFFILTILGLVFVGTLSSGAVLKGLVAATAGLMLALVGLDPQSSIPRFTFGMPELWGGVDLIAVTLGLFGVPELLDLAVSRSSIAGRAAPSKLTGIGQGLRDAIVHRWLIVRCSLIGTFVGIIPGLGTPVAQWMAYAHAVQSSPNKERFGRGAVEGSLGPGAANNSGLGGSLIPLVTFGIPGNVIAAVLLNAFLIQGIQPGPDMTTRFLPLTMSFVWTIVISNIIVVLLSLVFLRHIAKLTHVRSSLIVPVTGLFVFIGAYASNNVFFSVLVMLVAGFVGLVMIRLGWPRPPLIVGMVLGGLTERYFFLSYNRYDLEFLVRPVVLLLVVVMIVPIVIRGVLPTLRSIRAKRASRDSVGLVGDAPGGTSPAYRFSRGEVAFTSAIVVAAAAILVISINLPRTAGLMPMVVSGTLLVLAGLHLLASIVRGSPDVSSQNPRSEEDDLPPPTLTSRRSLAFVGWLLGTTAAIWLAGFTVAAGIAGLVYTLAARERWWVGLLLAGGLLAFVWTLENVFLVPFPRPALAALLGP